MRIEVELEVHVGDVVVDIRFELAGSIPGYIVELDPQVVER